MKATYGFLSLAVSLVLASCGPMTPADYAASKSEQRAEYPELQQVYRDGQSSEEIMRAIKKARFTPLLSKQSSARPAQGWHPRSWEYLEESTDGESVITVDRFAFGGMTSYLAAVVYYHRVFYDRQGRSIGWYVTHD